MVAALSLLAIGFGFVALVLASVTYNLNVFPPMQSFIDDMKRLIQGLKDEHTVVLIEHNMGIVMDISDTITVMQLGRVLAEGVPAEIRNDERVRTAYLGNMITGGKA